MPSFHVMAIIVAVAVFGIIALTVLIARQEARAGEQRRQMQAMLNGLLTESEVQLAVSRTGSPERFEAALTRTANDLSALAAELRSAAEIATTAMEGAVAATDAARGGGGPHRAGRRFAGGVDQRAHQQSERPAADGGATARRPGVLPR